MQIKQISRLFLLLFTLSLFATCKKYPEGPCISVRSKTNRVVGHWKVEKYLIDGADSTTVKYFSYCVITFTETEGALIGHDISDNCWQMGGFWEFIDHRKSLGIYCSINSAARSPLFLSPTQQWKILKLKYEEMWLQTEFNSKQYEIHLKRTS